MATIVERIRAGAASTRMRLAAALVVVTLVAGALVVIGVRTLLLNQMDERARTGLVQEYEEFRRFLQLGRDAEGGRVDGRIDRAGELYLQRTVLARSEVIVVVDHARGVVQSVPPQRVRLGDDTELLERWRGAAEATVTKGSAQGEPIMSLVAPVLRDGNREGTFVVAQFTAGERQEVDEAIRVVIVTTLISVLLVAATAWWIAGRILRPLRSMTQTARRISREDLSGRLDDPGGDGEVAVLVRTFNSMLDRLQRALDSQREFLSDAAHELRTPLTVLRGNVAQLRLGMVDDEERDEVITLLRDETDRMSRLVDDLVVLERAGRPDFLRPGPVDLSDLIEGIMRRLDTIEGPVWAIEPGIGVITADGERLTQAMMNLAVNAARHTPAGTSVRIGAALRGPFAELWVHDDGPGIPPEIRERIFDRGVRGGSGAGSGLGLAIARAIAQAHGGTLRLVETGIRGSRFLMSLPTDGPMAEEDR